MKTKPCLGFNASVALVVLVGALSIFLPDSGRGQTESRTMQGTVVSIDHGQLTFKTTDGQVVTGDFAPGLSLDAGVTTGARVSVVAEDSASGLVITSVVPLASGASAQGDPEATSPAMTSNSQATSSTPESNTELPRTASPVWGIGLLGLLALAGAFTLRQRRHAQSAVRMKARLQG